MMRHSHVAWRSPTFASRLCSCSQWLHMFMFCEIPSTKCFCFEVPGHCLWTTILMCMYVQVGGLYWHHLFLILCSLENCLQPKSLQKLFLWILWFLVYNWKQVKPTKVKQLYNGKVTQFPSEGERVTESIASFLLFSGSSICRVAGKKKANIRCK